MEKSKKDLIKKTAQDEKIKDKILNYTWQDAQEVMDNISTYEELKSYFEKEARGGNIEDYLRLKLWIRLHKYFLSGKVTYENIKFELSDLLEDLNLDMKKIESKKTANRIKDRMNQLYKMSKESLKNEVKRTHKIVDVKSSDKDTLVAMILESEFGKGYYNKMQEASKKTAQLVGKTFTIDNVTLKVKELAKGYVQGPMAEENLYWVEVIEGTYQGYKEGEQLTMSKEKLQKYLASKKTSSTNLIKKTAQLQEVDLENKFYYECGDCGYIFLEEAKLLEQIKCPKCGSNRIHEASKKTSSSDLIKKTADEASFKEELETYIWGIICDATELEDGQVKEIHGDLPIADYIDDIVAMVKKHFRTEASKKTAQEEIKVGDTVRSSEWGNNMMKVVKIDGEKLTVLNPRTNLEYYTTIDKVIKISSKKTAQEKRWVWGTRDEKWYLVGPEDRDYESGITQEEYKTLGPEKAKEKYLQPSKIGAQEEFKPGDKIIEIDTRTKGTITKEKSYAPDNVYVLFENEKFAVPVHVAKIEKIASKKTSSSDLIKKTADIQEGNKVQFHLPDKGDIIGIIVRIRGNTVDIKGLDKEDYSVPRHFIDKIYKEVDKWSNKEKLMNKKKSYNQLKKAAGRVRDWVELENIVKELYFVEKLTKEDVIEEIKVIEPDMDFDELREMINDVIKEYETEAAKKSAKVSKKDLLGD